MTRAFQKPKRLICDLETLSPTYGHFYAQPFERGFGTTIGNALRRVLLSSIEGAAITAVKIEGVLHEFTPIPNVTEDATNIIMNLKQVPMRLNVDHAKTIYLESDQAGEITSANITADPDIEILDPNVHIQEVKARGAAVIAVVTEGDVDAAALADHVIEVPETPELLSPVVVTVPLQLLAYHVAVLRGCDVDQPRNLAKSVTVE